MLVDGLKIRGRHSVNNLNLEAGMNSDGWGAAAQSMGALAVSGCQRRQK